jgi:hypothetical protein
LWCETRVEGFVWLIKGNWNGCLMNLCFYTSQKGKHKKRQLQAPKWFNIITLLVFYNLIESLFVHKSLIIYLLTICMSLCHIQNAMIRILDLCCFAHAQVMAKKKRGFPTIYDVKIFYWKLKRIFLPSLWLLIITSINLLVVRMEESLSF